MGDVVRLPVEITCFACEHHCIDWDSASRCALFDEPIESETFAARDCAGFEHI